MIKGIHSDVMSKVLGKVKCGNKERVVKQWAFANKPSHAGQVYGEKVLPNGNLQKRVTTAYGNSNPTIATDTRVYSPSGELLNAYYGVRNSQGTISYASNSASELNKLISDAKSVNPEMKVLPNLPIK